jgi:glycine cleavage system H protein
VTGKVTEINSSLKDHPQYVNEDPFEKGWMIKIAVQNMDDLKGLLSATAYQGLIPEES